MVEKIRYLLNYIHLYYEWLEVQHKTIKVVITLLLLYYEIVKRKFFLDLYNPIHDYWCWETFQNFWIESFY
jgi:hypothetical protein